MYNTTYPFFKYWDIAEFARLQGAVESYQKENLALREKIKHLEQLVKEKREELKIEEAINYALHQELTTLKKTYVGKHDETHNKDKHINENETKTQQKTILVDGKPIDEYIKETIDKLVHSKLIVDTKQKINEDLEAILNNFDGFWDVNKWGC